MRKTDPFLPEVARAGDGLVNTLLWRFSAYFRRKRSAEMIKQIEGCQTIIDLGGTPGLWNGLGRVGVVLLNIEAQEAPGFTCVHGDARDTGYADASFDLAFSNSVLEHVGQWEDQKRFAAETRRIGRRVYCQTPNRRFFFDPHYLTPFVHWLPWLPNQYWFVRYFTRMGRKFKITREWWEGFSKDLHELNFEEMQELFPDCRIHREKFLGMTKSFIAIR